MGATGAVLEQPRDRIGRFTRTAYSEPDVSLFDTAHIGATRETGREHGDEEPEDMWYRLGATAAGLVLIGASVIGLTTGCSTGSEPIDEPAPDATTTAPADPTPGPADETSTPPEETTPAPEAPTPGASVAKDDVAEVRKATKEQGLGVYVSPTGDGSGVVVDPNAPLPQVIIDDAHALIANTAGTTEAEEATNGRALSAMVSAMTSAGMPAFFVSVFAGEIKGGVASKPSFSVDQTIGLVTPRPEGLKIYGGTQEEVLKRAQPWFDENPGVPIITLDGVLNNG